MVPRPTHQIPNNIYNKFPWLNGSSEVLLKSIGEISEDVEDIENMDLPAMLALIFAKFAGIQARIEEFLLNIVESNETITTPTDDLTNLALYPLLQVILSLIGNRIISNAFQNTYAKHCYEELRKTQAIREYPNGLLEKIGQNVNINCQYLKKKMVIEGTQYPFRMDLVSFLSTASNLKEEQWKLINNRLIGGNVYLIRDKLIHLLREKVRRKVKPDFNVIDAKLKEELEKLPEIAAILIFIESLISKHTSRFNSSLLADGEKVRFAHGPTNLTKVTNM